MSSQERPIDGCFSCTGRCCYDVVVRVTPFDVARLARGQHLRFEEIVQPVLQAHDMDGGIRLDDSGDRFGMMLRRSPLESAACTFLVHRDGGVKRCGVYPDRPIVCDVYPFELRHGAVAMRSDVRCAPTDWNLATLDHRERRATLERYALGWRGAERIAAAWNAMPEPSGGIDAAFVAYLAFARRVCDAFAGVDPVLAELDDAIEAARR